MTEQSNNKSADNRYEQCRAQRANNGPGFVYCLKAGVPNCEHIGFMDTIPYCLNPDREAIIARTLADLN